MRRRYAATLLVAFSIALTVVVNAAPGTLYRGPYLQNATPTSVVVVWRTEGATAPILHYGSKPDGLNKTVAGSAITLRVSGDVDAPDTVPRLYKESAEAAAKRRGGDHDPSTAANTYQYEALVSGLPNDSKFFYAIYDGDRKLAGGDPDHYFVTQRPAGAKTDMRVWVLGDSGKGSNDQIMVYDAIGDYAKKTKRPIDHFIHVGDMAYDDGTDWEFQKRFFEPYQAMLRNTVVWPSLGNHEGVTSQGISGSGPYFDAYVVPISGEAGGAPSGTEAYYSFDISEVHFICMDSHDLDRKPDGAMAQWLRADLEQATAKWLIAFWHHPPYSKGTHDSDTEHREIEMRESFMPILESAGVDITLTGHSHIYERSMLMDGAYATPTVADGVILDDGDGNPQGDGAYEKSEGLNPNEGSVNIVAGHGGTTNGRMGTMPVMREILIEHGSVMLDIEKDTLTGVMVDKFGASRDLFSIVKRGTVKPTRVENPWQPRDDISLLTRLTFDFADDVVGEAPRHWRVASGKQTGMTVGSTTDGKGRYMRAQATGEALLGVYDKGKTTGFQYEAYLNFSDASAGAAGCVFGYVDDKNYWRTVVDGGAGVIRASRISDGIETVLLEKPIEVERGKTLKLKLVGSDEKVVVELSGNDAFEFAPGASLPKGHLGFYVPANSGVEFGSFRFRLF